MSDTMRVEQQKTPVPIHRDATKNPPPKPTVGYPTVSGKQTPSTQG